MLEPREFFFFFYLVVRIFFFFLKGNCKQAGKKACACKPFQQCRFGLVKDRHITTTKWQPKAEYLHFLSNGCKSFYHFSWWHSRIQFWSRSITEPREIYCTRQDLWKIHSLWYLCSIVSTAWRSVCRLILRSLRNSCLETNSEVLRVTKA